MKGKDLFGRWQSFDGCACPHHSHPLSPHSSSLFNLIDNFNREALSMELICRCRLNVWCVRWTSPIVDTVGLLAVSISAASVQGRDAADDAEAFSKEKYPSLSTLFIDSAYAGKWAQRMHQEYAVNVQVIRGPNKRRTRQWCLQQGDLFMLPPPTTGLMVMPKYWVVERTHTRNERARRLIMHHDRLFTVSEAWMRLAEARMLARRLTT